MDRDKANAVAERRYDDKELPVCPVSGHYPRFERTITGDSRLYCSHYAKPQYSMVLAVDGWERWVAQELRRLSNG